MWKKVEEDAWCSKCKAFMFSGSFPVGQARKTWNDVIRSDLKERKFSKYLPKYRNT